MRFRPSLVSTAAMLPALAILLGLASWQWDRHEAQEARLESVEARLYGPPATNDDAGAPPDSLHWRKAALTGHFLPDAPVWPISGRFEFGEPGFDLLEPFVLANGPTILVNRGWVPSTGWPEGLAASRPTTETLTLEGLILPAEGTTHVEPLPATATLPQRWPQRASAGEGPPFAAIAAQANPAVEQGWILVEGKALTRGAAKSRDRLPVSGFVPSPKQIGHFAYAMQWFLIACTLVCVWGYAGFLRGRAPNS